MSKVPSDLNDAALRVVLSVRETEQMKALKEENEKIEKKLETATKATAIIVKGFQTQAQNYAELITNMETEELISESVADALRQQMNACFRLLLVER